MANVQDPMAEIRASFFIECEELLEALQDGLQDIEDGRQDDETINVVFRAVHSIKGGAGAFGLETLVRFAHRYETVLDVVRSGGLAVESDILKLFFRCTDHLADLVQCSQAETPFPDAQGLDLITQLSSVLGPLEPQEKPAVQIDFQPMALSLDLDIGPDTDTIARPRASNLAEFHIHFAPSAELFETGNEPFIILRALQDLGHCDIQCCTGNLTPLEQVVPDTPYLSWDIALTTDVDHAEILSVFEFVEGLCELRVTESDNCAPAPEDAAFEATPILHVIPADSTIVSKDAATPSVKPAPFPANVAKSVVRVDLDRIERLVNLVGELVINQAMLTQSLKSAGLSPHSDAMSGLDEFQRLTRDIQDSVMMIRAQPVKSLFQRMSRIVRESSASVGKDVRLITDGENTEIDKTVIERLADPLTHLIRNAVDHGLEPQHQREASGKPSQGTITLTAEHRSGRVILEVSDDGGGINRSKVQQIAVDKGLIAVDTDLSDNEIDNLLFLPGFSTASEVSDLSGRGVGMDVVKTAIQSLGGRITITSHIGIGTKFSVSLPLTLAVLDGMIVKVADETIVLPLNVVVETLTLTEENLHQIRPGLNVVRVRGEFMPLFDLGFSLGYRAALSNYLDAVVLLIAHENGSHIALVVDDILDQRQVVIKGLDDSLYRAPGIAAATILGDGKIALILDPTDIVDRILEHSPIKQAS
jgi:two-component system chemotaxis sensor kinase CheA